MMKKSRYSSDGRAVYDDDSNVILTVSAIEDAPEHMASAIAMFLNSFYEPPGASGRVRC